MHARAERQAASEAIQALKSLESITNAGVNYQNYVTRVLDVKVKVDQYLAPRPKSPKSPQVRLDVENAMDLYVYAGQIWNTYFVTNVPKAVEVSEQARVLCPELESELDQQASRLKALGIEEKMVQRFRWISPSSLWRCAARYINQAETHNRD